MLNLGTAYSSIEVRLDRLEQGLAEAERKFAATGKKIDAEAKKIKRDVGQSLGELGRMLTVGVAAPILAIGTAAVKAAVDMDSLKRGLRAVTGSASETERQLKRLNDIAKLPGLGLKEVIEGTIRLQSAGATAAQAERSLKAFGNALATVGKGAEDLKEVNNQLAQMFSSGKIQGDEIKLMAERIPQLRGAIREAFGTSDLDLLRKSGITVEQFLEGVTRKLEKLPPIGNTVKNAFENFGQAANKALASIGETLLPMVTRALERLTPILDNIAAHFKDLPRWAQEGLGGLAVGGLIIGPALFGISKLIGAIGAIKTAWVATAAAIEGSAAFAFFRRLLINPAAFTAAALLAPQRAGGGVIPEQNTPQARISTLQYALGIAERRQTEFMRPGDRERLNKQVAYIKSEIAKAQKQIDAATGKVAGGSGDPMIDAAARAAAAARKKEAAEEAKRFAKERAEAIALNKVEMAAFRDKFSGQRVQAEQDFRERIPTLGMTGASDWLKARLAEIDKAEAEERKHIKEAHERKLEQIKRQVEKEANDTSEAYRKSAEKVEREAKRALDEAITRANDQAFLFKTEKDEQERRARNIAAYWMGIITRARELAANELSAFNMRGANLRESVPNQVIYDPNNSLSGNVDTERRSMPAAARTQSELREMASRVDAIRERLRSSFGGILGEEIAFEFTDSFARGLEKAFGSSSIGKIFARALTRWFDQFIQGALDRTIGGIANKIGKGGKFGIGDILGSFLGPVGKILGFADGGNPPVGRWSVVGERGPELIKPQSAMTVVPMGAGGRGGDIHIANVNIGSDYDVDRFMDRLAWHTKRRNAVNPGTF